MAIATLTLSGASRIRSTLINAAGFKVELNSSTLYTITDKEGDSLRLNGARFRTQIKVGEPILDGGAITGFTLTLSHKLVAVGRGYNLNAETFYKDVLTYLGSGDHKPLVNLFMGATRVVAGAGAALAANLHDLSKYSTIKSIEVTSGAVILTADAFAQSRPALARLDHKATVADTLADILGAAPTLAGRLSLVQGIRVTATHGPAFVALDSKTAAADAGVVAKIVSPYVLDVRSGAAHAINGHGAGLTLHAAGSKSTMTGGGARETFALGRRFGQATLVDFSRHLTGATHDTVQLSKSEFTSFAAMLKHATQSGSNVQITAADGSRLTIDHMTTAALAAAASDFKFV